jgi:hypothetical protein
VRRIFFTVSVLALMAMLPVEAEMFGPGFQPCGDQLSTPAVVECVQAKTNVADQRLNAAYKALQARIDRSTSTAVAFGCLDLPDRPVLHTVEGAIGVPVMEAPTGYAVSLMGEESASRVCTEQVVRSAHTRAVSGTGCAAQFVSVNATAPTQILPVRAEASRTASCI